MVRLGQLALKAAIVCVTADAWTIPRDTGVLRHEVGSQKRNITNRASFNQSTLADRHITPRIDTKPPSNVQQQSSAQLDSYNQAIMIGRQIIETLNHDEQSGSTSTSTDDPEQALRAAGWVDRSGVAIHNWGPLSPAHRPEIVSECIVPVGRTISNFFDARTPKVKQWAFSHPAADQSGVHEISSAFYENWYEKGAIWSMRGEGPTALQRSGQLTADLPRLRYWSDIAFVDYFKDKTREIGESTLHAVVQCEATNPTTLDIVKVIRANEPPEAARTPIVFPGYTFSPTSKKRHFFALMGSPFGKSVGFLLAQHKQDIGHYTVTEINLWTNGVGQPNISFKVRKGA